MSGAATITPLECYGGPLSGRKGSVFGAARFAWHVNGILVSNTEATEYRDVANADGVYVRMMRKKSGVASQEEILYWRRVPGAVPQEQ